MTPESGRFSLSKRERLCSKNTFSYLFTHGSSLRAGAISIYYAWDVPAELMLSPMMVAFAAPKRQLKEAVKRNYIKRRLREVFRHEKPELLAQLSTYPCNLVLLISYNSKKKASYSEIHYTLKKAFRKLFKNIDLAEKENLS